MDPGILDFAMYYGTWLADVNHVSGSGQPMHGAEAMFVTLSGVQELEELAD